MFYKLCCEIVIFVIFKVLKNFYSIHLSVKFLYQLVLVNIMKKGLLLVLMLFSLSLPVNSASIYGTIYDLELNMIDNVVVEIDTTPVQRMVAVDGIYSFTVNPGTYTLSASHTVNEITNYYADETLEVAEEGDFIYDLFLFPSFDDISDLELDDLEVEVEERDYSGMIYITIILLILIFTIFYFLKTQEKIMKLK